MTGTQRYAVLFIIVALSLGLLLHQIGRYRWYRTFIEIQQNVKNIQTDTLNSTISSADKVKRIDINTADVRTLTYLPGIGRETALRIVEYRSEKGRFPSIEELINVHGIGPKKLEKIKKYVTIE